MSDNPYEEFERLANIINKFGDEVFWKPITDAETHTKLMKLIEAVEESQTWDKSKNKDKGAILEELACFLLSRFQDAKVISNRLVADNETDVEVVLSEKILPEFIREYIGPKIICECKNYKNKTVDVGMVVKLADLIPKRKARFGMFLSLKGVGGYGWRYGEGKRKKIYLKDNIPIISFRVEEIRKLLTGDNFLTMIKMKLRALIDEVDDDTPTLPNPRDDEYTKRLHEVMDHLRKCDIFSEEELMKYKARVIDRYGEIEV